MAIQNIHLNLNVFGRSFTIDFQLIRTGNATAIHLFISTIAAVAVAAVVVIESEKQRATCKQKKNKTQICRITSRFLVNYRY